MAEEVLQIKIGADIVDVSKSLGELEAEFKNLQASLKNATGNEVTKINAELDNLATTIQRVKAVGKTGFDEFGQRIKPLPKQINDVSKASGAATRTLTDTSRVFQDLAFGPVAVANNLDPLLQSLRSFSKESGGFKNAASALASSLLGGGGLALALSLVTFSLSGGFDALKKYIPGLKEAAKAQEEAAKAAKEYQDENRQLAVNIQKQRIETQQLVALARGDIGSKKEQELALKKLNDLIPDYIGKLNRQNIATAEGAKIIDAYVLALEKQATAELLVGRAAEQNVKKFELKNEFDRKQATNLQRRADLERQIAEIEARASNNIGSGLDLQNSTLSALRAQLIDLRKEYQTNIQTFIDQTASANKEIEKLRAEINKNTVIVDPTDDPKPKKEATKANEALSESLRVQIQQLKDLQREVPKTTNAYSAFESQIILLESQLRSLGKGTAASQIILSEGLRRSAEEYKKTYADVDRVFKERVVGTQKSLNVDPKKLQLGLAQLNPEILQQAIALNEARQAAIETANTLTGILAPAFDNVFQAIFNGQSILQSLVSSLKAVVAQLIAAIAKALIFRAILSATGGGILGAGIPKLGAFLKAGGSLLGQAGPGFNGGGALFGTPSIAGGQSVNVVVTGQLRGQDIIFAANRAATNNRING